MSRTTRSWRLQNEVHRLLNRVVQEKLSHAEYLNLRDELIASEDWVRSTRVTQEQWIWFMRGYMKAMQDHHTEWCHLLPPVNGVGGYYRPAAECTTLAFFDIREVDTDKSSFCWKGTQKVFL